MLRHIIQDGSVIDETLGKTMLLKDSLPYGKLPTNIDLL